MDKSIYITRFLGAFARGKTLAREKTWRTFFAFFLEALAAFAFISLAMLFVGCGGTSSKPFDTSHSMKELVITADDPLGIGTKPVAPAKQQIPSFIHNGTKPLAPLVGHPRDFVAIINQGGGVISAYSSAEASWVWVHSASFQANFGDAFNWNMQNIGDGFVRFVNKLTRTCLNAYGSGAIHYPCDANNPNQFFRILPMQNGAVLIQSAVNQLCLQTGMHKRADLPLSLGKCLNIANAEQQWSIIPPFIKPTPIVLQP